MKKILLLQVCIFLFIIISDSLVIAQKPKFLWVKQAGGLDFDGGSGIAVDGSNNIIVTGSLRGLVNFDDTVLNGGNGGFLLQSTIMTVNFFGL
jgi:hypothetical protein